MNVAIDPGRDRVRKVTSNRINQKIDMDIRDNILYYAGQSNQVIQNRIAELDREWDIERLLMLNASVLSFTGVMLAVTKHKAWLLLPGVITGFLIHHALRGWCPPIPIFRKMGVRTRKEIEVERHALLRLLSKP